MRVHACLVVAVLACAITCLTAAEAAVGPAVGDTPFVAIPVAERDLYHIDPGHYFPGADAESSDRKQLLADIAAFPTVAPRDAVAFEAWLNRADDLHARLSRHDAYLALRAALNIDDQAAADAGDQLDDTDDRFALAVATSLRGLGKDEFARMVSARPALAAYRFAFDEAVRVMPHQVSPDQQAALDAITGPALSGWWKLYQDTLRGTSFAKVHASDGRELDARKDADALAIDPDRAVRETAWRQSLQGYASRADIYADILFGIVRMQDRMAQLRHFADAPSATYFERLLTRQEVDQTLAAVQAHADLFKRYRQLVADHVAAVDGIRDPRSWDMSLPDPGFAAPRFTLDQARANALAALAPLGEDYVAHFRALLDPANHRVDIASEEGRREGSGFSIGGPRLTSSLFISVYRGYLDDNRRLIHEGGHAVHRQLMSEARIPAPYQDGPSWMFEAFALFNQLLLYDHLYETSSDSAARAYYLNALVDDMTFETFGSAEEGALEQSIYDGVVAGRISKASDLDVLTLSTLAKFDTVPVDEPELAHLWATKKLMYEDPNYQVNYLFASLVANRMFKMCKDDPVEFRKRYMALLSKGFYAPPQELLKTVFGDDVSWPAMVDADMKIVGERVDELGKLYAGAKPQH